jgi:hypothetical protein
MIKILMSEWYFRGSSIRSVNALEVMNCVFCKLLELSDPILNLPIFWCSRHQNGHMMRFRWASIYVIPSVVTPSALGLHWIPSSPRHKIPVGINEYYQACNDTILHIWTGTGTEDGSVLIGWSSRVISHQIACLPHLPNKRVRGPTAELKETVALKSWLHFPIPRSKYGLIYELRAVLRKRGRK